MSRGKEKIVSDAELGLTQEYRIYSQKLVVRLGVRVHHESEPENEQVMRRRRARQKEKKLKRRIPNRHNPWP